MVHAFAVFFQVLRGLGRADHFQAKPQTCHRRTQFVGHGTYQLALNGQQLLQVLGHAVERRRQSPHRVRTTRRHTGFQAALGDPRGCRFQPAQAAFQLPHQQIHDQADQAQPQGGNQHQPFRRIRIHLVQRADFQHPRRADHAGEHPDRIALLAQRHHGVAL
ncbi:hypothetical protein D3C76_1138240 [compost metagenome]